MSPSANSLRHPEPAAPAAESKDAKPVRFAPSPCGGVHVLLAGRPVLLRCSGALWLAPERALVVADLHLEKGSAYAARGQMLPPFDTRETLNRLEAEVAALDPAMVVFLGDALHDGAAEERIAADDAARLMALAAGRALVWVEGNHDAGGPRSLAGRIVEEMTFGPLILRHEPQAGLQFGEVAGHLHPAALVKGMGRVVRRRCFATDGDRLILPAFGAYAGGLNLRDRAFAGMFSQPPCAVALGGTRCHPVSWRQLV